jgi:hypothetical protein
LPHDKGATNDRSHSVCVLFSFLPNNMVKIYYYGETSFYRMYGPAIQLIHSETLKYKLIDKETNSFAFENSVDFNSFSYNENRLQIFPNEVSFKIAKPFYCRGIIQSKEYLDADATAEGFFSIHDFKHQK